VPDPTPAGGEALLAVLERAAWWGRPAEALPVLAGLQPEAQSVDVRWLAGVCLGALGRYAQAGRWLDPARDSRAASCLASHLRQVGRHAEAEPLDRLALTTATTPAATADALTGLAADAVGPRDLAAARDRLAAATRHAGDYPEWRTATRLAWVTAEVALCRDDPDTAIAAGRTAVRLADEVSASRHAAKSRLVLAAGLHADGRTRAADRVLRAAGSAAARLDLAPLTAAVRTFRSEILQVRAPRTAERERQRAAWAQSIIEEPADHRTYR
jgi:hypothetical protein